MNAINNLSTRKRILGIFSIVLIVAMLIGVLGIFSANTLGSEISDMYHHDTEPIAALSHVIQNVMTLSSSFDMAILAAMAGDYDEVKAFEDSVNQLYTETDTLLREVKDKIYDNDAQILYDSAFQKYYDTLVPTGPEMFKQLYAGDLVMAEEIMGAADISIGEMTDEFKQCLDKKVEKAQTAFEKNEASVKSTITLLIVILASGFVVTIILAALLSSSITKPMLSMLRFAKETSETGNLELSTREIEAVAGRGDEIGATVRAFCEMTAMFREQAQILKTISDGDFTPELTLKSQTDTVGVSLTAMLDEIGTMLRDVAAASKQVAQGVHQIADGAGDLSDSISEQNTSIENISSSLHNINEQVKNNMESSNSAKELVAKMSKEAQSGDKKMADMVQAVRKINEASGGIGKIMKTIDDIAFQTNILALNAAVEAARAGQHGKGFAVVAEEVRNLASKSAAAAAESNALISSALQLTESGVHIAEDTRKSIETITSGIQNILLFIEQMSDAAKNQSVSMDQLDKSVVDISEIVQRTSANAEQSSAACEEISSLSVSLDEMVARFKLKSEPAQLPRHY